MKKIAFFDSGIGGLSVLHEALKHMPNERYIYFADSNHAPYGTKSSIHIQELVLDAVDFLVQQDIKALVLACNTATSVAIKALRLQYDFPIIGMEPAVKPAVESSKHKKTLVCATERTLAENKLKLLIKDLNAEEKVAQLSLQGLVLFAEKFEFSTPQVHRYLTERFSSIDWREFDSIVLGCTHFLFFKKAIRSIIPIHVRILDGNFGTIKQLKSKISHPPLDTERSIDYVLSKNPMPLNYFEKYFHILNQQSSL